MALHIGQRLICEMVFIQVVVRGSRASTLSHFFSFKASVSLFARYRTKTASQRSRLLLVLTDRGVFLFHWERILAIFSSKSDLRRTLVRLLATRVEYLQLLLLGLDIDCEFRKSVLSDDKALAWSELPD